MAPLARHVVAPEGAKFDVGRDSVEISIPTTDDRAAILVPTAFMMAAAAILEAMRDMRVHGPLHGLALAARSPGSWMALGLSYLVTAWLVNRTVVTLSPGHLIVRHGPIPIAPSRTFTREGIAQIFVVAYRGARGALRHAVYCVDREGVRTELVDNLGDAATAHFLEAKLEEAMGIGDYVVEGELAR